jgi:F420-dependent oxidoreductase-like protein
MVALNLMIEGQDGLTWARWQRLVAEAEALGFAGVFRSDHYTNALPPDKDSLEMIVSLTYLANTTQRVQFGPLVAPISMRDPRMLARQAAALDDLSGGRMILGLGAGWQQREHSHFGYELGDIATRMARFTEGIEVVTRLLNSDEPVSYEGHFFQLHDAILLPRPQRPGGPRILIGGNGPKRTLPLAARYAHVWNATYLTPEHFHERSQELDTLLLAADRQPGDVKRTMMCTLFFGRTMDEVSQRLSQLRERPDFAGKSLDDVIKALIAGGHGIVGTPDMLVEQIQTYAKAGVEELMLQWFETDDIEGLRAFATSVFPRL